MLCIMCISPTLTVMARPRAQTLQQKLGFYDEDLKKPDHDAIMYWVAENAEEVVNTALRLHYWQQEEINLCKELIIKSLNFCFGRDDDGNICSTNESIRPDEYTILEEQINFSPLPERAKTKVYELEWEHPVTTQVTNQYNGYKSAKHIVGFIDLKIDCSITRLGIEEAKFEFSHADYKLPNYVSVVNYFQDVNWIQYRLPLTVYVEVKTEIKSLGELFRQLSTYKEYNDGIYLIICPDDRHKQTIIDQGFLFFKYDRNLFK